jgi:hypothetical protein
MLALGNTMPFVGPLTIDSEIKRLLFCPGCDFHALSIVPEGYQFLVLNQNRPSGTLVIHCNNSETPPCPEQVPGDKGCCE